MGSNQFPGGLTGAMNYSNFVGGRMEREFGNKLEKLLEFKYEALSLFIVPLCRGNDGELVVQTVAESLLLVHGRPSVWSEQERVLRRWRQEWNLKQLSIESPRHREFAINN